MLPRTVLDFERPRLCPGARALLVVAGAVLGFAVGDPLRAQEAASPVPLDPVVEPGSGVWRQMTQPASAPPAGRLTHSQIYDPIRRRLVVFGGFFGSTYLGDTWALSLDGSHSWQPILTGPGPGPRRAHSAIYDPLRDRMIVFGGVTGFGDAIRLNEVWALSLSGSPAWSQILPSGAPPSGRFVHATIYDPVRDRMIVFGGHDGAPRNDVWALSLGPSPAWTQLAPSGAPPSPRNDLMAIYDPTGDRLVLFGGWDGSQLLNDLWALSLASTPAWTQIQAVGPAPAPRRTPALAYDPARQNLVLFGGWNGGPGFDDAWILPLAGSPQWTQLPVTSPRPSRRWGHGAVVDPVTDRLIVFGGVDLTAWRNDAWALSLGEGSGWELLQVTAPPGPSPRRAHRAIFDAERDRMVLFGGTAAPSDSTRLDEVWTLDLPTGTWSQVAPVGPGPTGRYVFGAAHDSQRDRLIVFGGYDGSHQDDVWALPLEPGGAWIELHPLGTGPSGRDDLEAVYDPVGDRLIVLMGWDGSQILSEVWALRLSDPPQWEQLDPVGPTPLPRRTPSAAFDVSRRRVLLFGGWDGGPGFDDTWELVLEPHPRWRRLPTPGPTPGPRWGQTLVHDAARDRLVLFGGVDLMDWRNDVWAFSLAPPGRWSLLEPTGPAPTKRLTHSAIFDPVRDRMLVFGGYVGSSYLGDLWALEWGASATAGEGEDEGDGGQPAANPEPVRDLSILPASFAGREGVELEITLPVAGDVRVEVFDARGRRTWRRAWGAAAGEQRVRLPGSALPGAGIYWARVLQAGRRAITKVVALP